MAGGFSTPKKDKKLKVSSGQPVKAGQILCKGLSHYKAGKNVYGLDALMALCPGKVNFTKKKTSRGNLRTHINVSPETKAPKKK